MCEFLTFRICMDPDQFVNAFGDEFADPLVEMIRFNSGNLRKAALLPDFLCQDSKRSSQIFQINELSAVQNSDDAVVFSALQLKG